MASSQYSVNEQGEKIIAPSLRADGSVRKERKVRAGYIPQDEVPVYVPRQIRERRAAAGQTGSASTSSMPAQRRPATSTPSINNNSIPGYSESPPRSRGGTANTRGGAHRAPALNAPAATSSSGHGTIDDAVNALTKLEIRGETTAATTMATGLPSTSSTAPRQNESNEDIISSKPILKGRGAANFKYQTSNTTSSASNIDAMNQQRGALPSDLTRNSIVAGGDSSGNRNQKKEPVSGSGLPSTTRIPDDDDDERGSPPPGFSDPWED